MKQIVALIIAAMMTFAWATGAADAQSDTSINYQGLLNQGGQPFTGNVLLHYCLWDEPVGGNMIGEPVVITEFPIVNGLITVDLNFAMGAAGRPDPEPWTIFDGSPRWLQIRINDVELSPRQKVTPAPMSIHSHRAAGAVGDFVLHPPDPGMPARLFFGEGGPWFCTLSDQGVTLNDSMGGPGTLGFGAGGPSILGVAPPNDDMPWKFALQAPPNDGLPVALAFGEGGPSIGGFGELGIIIDNGMGDPIAIIDDNDMPMLKIAPVSGPGALAFGPDGSGISLNFMPSPFAAPSLNFKGGFVGFGLADGMAPTSGIQLPMAAGSPAGAGLATAWNTYSSSRWKENVETIPDALEKVLALRGVEFAWRDDDSGGDPALLRDIGFIAEEVALVVPELVLWEQDGINAHGLKYDRITALAVEAIKEQHDQIEHLIAENDDLRDRLAILEFAVAELLATQKGPSR